MKKYLILYCAPAAVLEDWMKKDEAERKPMQDKMKADWDAWAAANAASIVETAGAGKNVRVTPEGASEAKNDVMMYSLVEAETPEAASAMFVGHPHLDITGSWIEVMPANMLPGMQK